MQINHNSDTVTYLIEEAELLSGCHLNYLQRAVLQNMRVEIMQEIVSLTPDSMSAENKESYWQRKAYLDGQLSILTLLIEKSIAIESTQTQANQE